jgi:hypothetical protein
MTRPLIRGDPPVRVVDERVADRHEEHEMTAIRVDDEQTPTVR